MTRAHEQDARRLLHADFRPRRARRVAYPVAAVAVLAMTAVAFAVPEVDSWGDRVGFLLLGAGIAAFLHRQASVRVVPTEGGLVVHNLFLTRSLEWAQVVGVSFGGGRPWVQLDLSDGDTLSVMAIQRADGARGDAEASRMATLVALHSQPDR